ncbi:Syntaxin-51-like protein [Drosera capensis]
MVTADHQERENEFPAFDCALICKATKQKPPILLPKTTLRFLRLRRRLPPISGQGQHPRKMASTSELWMQDYNDASKLRDEINNLISEAKSLPPSGPQTQRHFSTTRRKIHILRTKLDTLDSILSGVNFRQPLSTREMNKRKEMLTTMRSKVSEMAMTLNTFSAANRESLLGTDSMSNDLMKRVSGMDNHGIVGFQRQIMREQDESLAKLEETVVSTKHIALAVNEELDLQTRLLDSLDDHVETTTSRLQANLFSPSTKEIGPNKQKHERWLPELDLSGNVDRASYSRHTGLDQVLVKLHARVSSDSELTPYEPLIWC